MKYVLTVLTTVLVITNAAYADKADVLFQGFDASILSYVDAMTDEKYGVLYLKYDGPISIEVLGHNDFTIKYSEEVKFAPNENHAIRVEKEKPFKLKCTSNGDGLKPTDKKEAEIVIKSLVNGKKIKLRYYLWPQLQKTDTELVQNPHIAYVYFKAAKAFGWKDYGVSPKLSKVELRINKTDNAYTCIRVNGNNDLMLQKFDDKATILVKGIFVFDKSFGFYNNKWIIEPIKDDSLSLVIRDSNGNIVFDENIPRKTEEWPVIKKAAKIAWQCSPLGSIEIRMDWFGIGKRVPLYGFRELWKWGLDNAGFPSLD